MFIRKDPCGSFLVNRKPGYVVGGHLSCFTLAGKVTRCRERGGGPPLNRVRLPCSVGGLPCRLGHPRRGGLLPRLFTLTVFTAVYFLWHCPSRRRDKSLTCLLPVAARTFLCGCPQRPPD